MLKKLFTEYFIEAGFEAYGICFNPDVVTANGNELSFHGDGSKFVYYKKTINPKNNYYGVSTYEPDLIMIKGKKCLTISMQGVSTPDNRQYAELFDKMSIRYILMEDDGKKIHESWTGELPSEETINQFIN